MRVSCTVGILLLLVGLSCKRPESKTPQADTKTTVSDIDQKLAELKGWHLSTETDKMDNTPAVYLSKLAETDHGAGLTIRCTRGKTALFVATDDIVDNGRVRIKFDDAKPQPQVWNEASNHQGLFAPDPIGLAKRLSQAQSFLLEYSPFQKQPTTIGFNVSGLAEKLNSVAEPCGWAKIEQAKARAQAETRHQAQQITKAMAELRQTVSFSVRPCSEFKGKWCWYDPNELHWKYGSAPKDTPQLAVDDALQKARANMAFKADKAAVEKKFSVEIPLPEYQ